MKNSESIAQLEKIEFHDVPVEKIAFVTDDTNQFIVCFSLYNEENENFDDYLLTFEGIIQLKTDKLELSEKSSLEIYSLDYHQKDVFECTILFLCGTGEPSLEVHFTCESVNLKKTSIVHT